MLFVGQLRMERARDREFWAVLWQGAGPPSDFKLIAAYNLMTDLRILVFEAESTASIRWLDKLNMVGHFECQPALDQTEGYQAAVGRDIAAIEHFFRARYRSEALIAKEVGFRAGAMAAETIADAIKLAQQPG